MDKDMREFVKWVIGGDNETVEQLYSDWNRGHQVDRSGGKIKLDTVVIQALQKLYNSCLGAKGAYEAIKLGELDVHLPGYNRCVVELKEAIDFAKKTGLV